MPRWIAVLVLFAAGLVNTRNLMNENVSGSTVLGCVFLFVAAVILSATHTGNGRKDR